MSDRSGKKKTFFQMNKIDELAIGRLQQTQ